jgi:hypothetical protein
VTPAISLTVDRADATPGGVIGAAWAGNPMPTSSDYLRLFALGSSGDEYDDALIYWWTPNASAARCCSCCRPICRQARTSSG